MPSYLNQPVLTTDFLIAANKESTLSKQYSIPYTMSPDSISVGGNPSSILKYPDLSSHSKKNDSLNLFGVLRDFLKYFLHPYFLLLVRLKGFSRLHTHPKASDTVPLYLLQPRKESYLGTLEVSSIAWARPKNQRLSHLQCCKRTMKSTTFSTMRRRFTVRPQRASPPPALVHSVRCLSDTMHQIRQLITFSLCTPAEHLQDRSRCIMKETKRISKQLQPSTLPSWSIYMVTKNSSTILETDDATVITWNIFKARLTTKGFEAVMNEYWLEEGECANVTLVRLHVGKSQISSVR